MAIGPKAKLKPTDRPTNLELDVVENLDPVEHVRLVRSREVVRALRKPNLEAVRARAVLGSNDRRVLERDGAEVLVALSQLRSSSAAAAVTVRHSGRSAAAERWWVSLGMRTV